jgi:hypothetical protein
MVPFKLIVTQVGIVCNILINTVRVIWCIAVAIIVIGLPITGPAALGSMGCANGWVKLWKGWHFKDGIFRYLFILFHFVSIIIEYVGR